MSYDKWRDTIINYAKDNKDEWQEIALKIHEKPEVSNYEFFASETLSNALAKIGFQIERPAAGHRTGFAASYKSEKPGPVICFLAEFDALAGIGHGCGHNLFGATSSLAAASLKSVIDETGGEVRVYGTPGEEGGENGSAKGSFVREGYFNDVDAALCVHPGTKPQHELTGKNLGCVPVDIEFFGVSAHAAGEPEKGVNALDALILTYNAVNALRQQLTDDVRIHGIITNGGTAPNAIPDYAAAKFYLRAASKKGLESVYEKVEKIVEGAALATGARGTMKPYQNWVENMVPTPTLDAVYEKHLNEFGEHITHIDNPPLGGSSDVGNVSQVIPTIQPCIAITDCEIRGHSAEMVEASKSQKGLDSIELGAKVLALVGLDLITDKELLDKVKADHAYQVVNQ
jgi:amidohydrolase